VQTSTHIYQTKQYNFLGENCHAYVAHFLNSINYAGAAKAWSPTLTRSFTGGGDSPHREVFQGRRQKQRRVFCGVEGFWIILEVARGVVYMWV
jgi:Protein of unknown function (DUF778)